MQFRTLGHFNFVHTHIGIYITKDEREREEATVDWNTNGCAVV